MYRGLKEAKNARVLYLDMNSFFASIEQQVHPELRGRPTAAVSHIGPAGTILAASYEAKALGLFTGMRLKEAWQLCPDLQLRETDATLYRAVHKHFMRILHEIFGEEVHPRSIDEAAIFLAPNWQTSEQAMGFAQQIKERFHHELGAYIRCSIGIAPNSLLAKLATDLKKPNGLVEITLENTEAILSSIPLTALPGIAERSSRNLQRWNIHTPLDFYHTSPHLLRQRFGIWGHYWWLRLHGYECDDTMTPHKSISHQHALSHWTQQTKDLTNTFTRMADRMIHRLRKNHLQCRDVWVYASLRDYTGIAREHHFPAPVSSYQLLFSTLERLFHELPRYTDAPIRKLSLGFNTLSPAINGWQPDLFLENVKAEGLSRALEVVRAKHGFQAIQRGNVIRLDPQVAKEQLGFGRIRDY